MSVPKCRECSYHALRSDGWGQNSICHWCTNPKAMIGAYRNHHSKEMYAKEFKTSPKWCPERRGESA